MSNIEILSTANDWINDGHKVAIATVLKTWGSAPRRAGSQLAIRDDGHMVGSVSGDGTGEPFNGKPVSHAGAFTTGEVFTGTGSAKANGNISAVGSAVPAFGGTLTADKLVASSTNADHTIHRIYNLSAYDTFDDDSIKWDTDTQRFDEGASGTSPSQQYTCLLYTSPSPRDS